MQEPRDQLDGASDRSDPVSHARALWLGAVPPPLQSLFTPRVLADDQVLADVIAIDIEERRSRGLACGLSTYLNACPQALTIGSVRRIVLTGEFISRADEDIEAVRLSLTGEYPQIAEDIAAVAALVGLFRSESDTASHRHSIGDRLGKYRLDSLLGSGSFAHTYLAWDTSLRRHVALKVLDAPELQGIESGNHVLSEARAAAGLDHESIVRVHEAGRFVEGGECYLDTQFVGRLSPANGPDGEGTVATTRTLDDLLTQGPVDPVKAASLIAAITRGVAAAHARGITHRDIKPSNILLNTAEMPLLADFGLAELDHTAAATSDSSEEPTGENWPRRRIAGTPAYIAPECARGEPATPLSDIFSLGCTFRSLLSGQPPRKTLTAGRRSSFAEVLTMAREQPLPPLASLVPNVPRTLARICDRATAHDPAARYASADRFAADLQAFIEHRPTEADPPGTTQVAALWARRHRKIAVVGAVSMLLITVSTIVFVIRLSIERTRAREAERIAQVQRDEAVAAKNTIELMNRFVTRTFNSTRGQKATRDITVKDSIDLAAARVGRTFADRPVVEAAVRHFLGQAALHAGSLQTAEVELSKALSLRREHLGATHPDTIATLRQWCDLLTATGKRAESDEMLEQLVHAIGQEACFNSLDGLSAISVLARRAVSKGDVVASRQLLERAVEAYDRLPPDGSSDQQGALNGLVEVYQRLNLWPEAVAAQQKIVALNTKNLGPEDISTLNALQAVGWVLREAGRPVEAEAIYRDVLARYRATVGDGHFATLTVSLDLASLLLPERSEEALTLIRDVQHRSVTLGKTSVIRLRASILLGAALDASGSDRAEVAMRDAVTFCMDTVGPENKWTREAISMLASFLDRHGRTAEAAAVRAR